MSLNWMATISFLWILKKTKMKKSTFFAEKNKFYHKLKSFCENRKRLKKKQNDYDKIVEVSNFCRKLIAENKKDAGLKKIMLVSNQGGFIINEIASYKFQKKLPTILNINFMIQ